MDSHIVREFCWKSWQCIHQGGAEKTSNLFLKQEEHKVRIKILQQFFCFALGFGFCIFLGFFHISFHAHATLPLSGTTKDNLAAPASFNPLLRDVVSTTWTDDGSQKWNSVAQDKVQISIHISLPCACILDELPGLRMDVILTTGTKTEVTNWEKFTWAQNKFSLNISYFSVGLQLFQAPKSFFQFFASPCITKTVSAFAVWALSATWM